MDYDWKTLLAPVSARLLDTADSNDIDWLRRSDPEAERVLASGWLGYPGATEAQIAAAEARLGKSLPPDYRQFLLLTNGWRDFRQYPFGLVRLLPVEEIDGIVAYDDRERIGRVEAWLELKTTGQLSEYEDEPPEDHFRATILIGESDGNECIMLNPLGVNDRGEWEAWIYHNETGISIYASFWELMQERTELCMDDLEAGRLWRW
jgi:hypothetical protein